VHPCILASDDTHAIGYSHDGLPIVLHEKNWTPALPGLQRTINDATYHTVLCESGFDTYWIRPLPPELNLYGQTREFLAGMDQNALRQ